MYRTRRQFLRDLAVAAPFVVAPGALVSAASDQAATLAPWDRAAVVLGRIVAPRFPDRHFQITRFGAVGDGRADCNDGRDCATHCWCNCGYDKIMCFVNDKQAPTMTRMQWCSA